MTCLIAILLLVAYTVGRASATAHYPPCHVYLLGKTGQHVRLRAYNEDGTVRADCWDPELTAALGVEAATMMGIVRNVFNLQPSDLTILKVGGLLT